MTTATTAKTSHETFSQQKAFGSLDGLRAFSILAVLWHHTFEVPTGWRATERGFLGVDLFFVISGFLIVTLLLRERDRRGISLKNFYVRRFLRIFPIYYGVLIGLSIVFLTIGRHANMAPAFWADLPWAATYTSNWAPLNSMATFLAITWSLSAEEQFYIVWPPVERHLRRLVLPLLFALLLLSQLVHFGVLDGVLARFGFGAAEPQMLKQTGFTPILLGVVLAHALHHPAWHERLARVLTLRATPVVAAVAIVFVCSVAPVDLTGWPRLSLHLLMVVLVGSCVIREDHLLRPVLQLPPLVRIGVLSYGIYLLHMICRHVCHSAIERIGLDERPWLFLSTLGLTVIIAQVSFTFFEQRFLRLKDRFTS